MLGRNPYRKIFGHDLDKNGHVREAIKELFEFKGHVVVPYYTIGEIGDTLGHDDGDLYAIYLAKDIADRYGWEDDDYNERFIKVYKP